MQYKDITITVTNDGMFQAEVEDHKLETDTLAALKVRIDRALASNRKRTNLDLELIERYGNEYVPVKVLGLHAGNGTLRIKGRKKTSQYRSQHQLFFPGGAEELELRLRTLHLAQEALSAAEKRWGFDPPYVSSYALRDGDTDVTDAERELAEAYAKRLEEVTTK